VCPPLLGRQHDTGSRGGSSGEPVNGGNLLMGVT
jgi:hypothetical protein